MTTDSPISAISAGPDEQAPQTCASCGHLDSAHDVIGRRWCAVSAQAAGSRTCMCSQEVQKTRVLSHY